MKTIYQIILFSILTCPLFATQVRTKALDELVAESGFIVEAKVIGVEMHDSKGMKVLDDAAATGPGISNQLFLRVKVAKNGFIYSKNQEIPNEFLIPLWQMWHDTLAHRKEQNLGKSYLFLLKGKKFEPTYPAGFKRKLSELPDIKSLIKKAENKP